ncbi:hypothetical protein ABID97_001934 [Variovorax sp. OAS795]|uniref:tail completion protein gp17 n=1 Tax=Variovorax sp. OAS795 TaxID=3034231 RepID=UPI00339A4123
MSLEQKVYDALKGLVSNRVYASTFPQLPAVPITPAILFTFISDETIDDICGDDTAQTANTRVQVDIYSTDFDSTRSLRIQALTAMAAVTPPTRCVGGFSTYEPDLKLHRVSLDFIHYPSSA